jgi:alpha-amylase/alpha-mannosidase (GH57 family)
MEKDKPNKCAPKQAIVSILISEKVAPHTLIVGDFNTLLLPIDRTSRQKSNREMLELNDVINQMDQTNIYRTFHLYPKEYAFFLAVQEIFLKLTTYLHTKRVSLDSKKWS